VAARDWGGHTGRPYNWAGTAAAIFTRSGERRIMETLRPNQGCSGRVPYLVFPCRSGRSGHGSVSRFLRMC